MNEREMLMFAAKAMGCEVLEVFDGGNLHVKGPGIHKVGWNSLEDDGDALRLAVKLRIPVTPIYEWTGPWDCGGTLKCPYAAIRRAIVRAAAEIGKAMP